jgi:hypothetical protein
VGEVGRPPRHVSQGRAVSCALADMELEGLVTRVCRVSD